MRASLAKRWLGVLGPIVWIGWVIAGPSWAGSGHELTPNRLGEGRELFLTDWTLAGREASRGDGLGPVFNERSCVACHNQGGPGGAGGSQVNVTILTDGTNDRVLPHDRRTSDVVPGFASEKSLVLHRFGTDPGYGPWRSNVLKTFDPSPSADFRVRKTQRNTPALFGAGLIDSIPESVLQVASLQQAHEVSGRISRLKGGKVGRFGWKGQTATLGEFVRVACANELGLENPGHSQSPNPLRPGDKAPGLDLTEADCSALTGYVASLPQPVEFLTDSQKKTGRVGLGRIAFSTIGCASCHMPQLGEVEGIYSDLLLHDMGQSLSDSGEYYGQNDSSSGFAFQPPKASEWRTPPLWGLRDSAPYLHDGRAATMEQAIEQHDGEALNSAERYKRLDRETRQNLNAFLLTLSSPQRFSEEHRRAKTR